jgi:hypothetical protein
MRFGVGNWSFEKGKFGALDCDFLFFNRILRTFGIVKTVLFADSQIQFFVEGLQKVIALLLVMQFGKGKRIA